MALDPKNRTCLKTDDLLRESLVGDPHVPPKYAPVASSQPPRISSGFETSCTVSIISQSNSGWFRSLVARRQIGAEIKTCCEKIALLPTTRDEGVLYFFREDLPALHHAAQMQAPVVQLALRQTLEKNPERRELEPWMAPIQIVSGDLSVLIPAWERLSIPALGGRTKVYLAALHHAGRFQPREATHLVRRLFDVSDPATRALCIEALTLSSNLGNVQEVGNAFVKLMAATTKEERDRLIYPMLLQVVARGRAANTASTAEKVARLETLLRGWLAETPLRHLSPETLSEIRRILV